MVVIASTKRLTIVDAPSSGGNLWVPTGRNAGRAGMQVNDDPSNKGGG
jgi:hypothetical protein